MIRIHTCEFTHTKSYVIDQSYNFVITTWYSSYLSHTLLYILLSLSGILLEVMPKTSQPLILSCGARNQFWNSDTWSSPLSGIELHNVLPTRELWNSSKASHFHLFVIGRSALRQQEYHLYGLLRDVYATSFIFIAASRRIVAIICHNFRFHIYQHWFVSTLYKIMKALPLQFLVLAGIRFWFKYACTTQSTIQLWWCVSFLLAVGNSFWCYAHTQCTIQLCCCVSFLDVAGNSSHNENIFLK